MRRRAAQIGGITFNRAGKHRATAQIVLIALDGAGGGFEGAQVSPALLDGAGAAGSRLRSATLALMGQEGAKVHPNLELPDPKGEEGNRD